MNKFLKITSNIIFYWPQVSIRDSEIEIENAQLLTLCNFALDSRVRSKNGKRDLCDAKETIEREKKARRPRRVLPKEKDKHRAE